MSFLLCGITVCGLGQVRKDEKHITQISGPTYIYVMKINRAITS